MQPNVFKDPPWRKRLEGAARIDEQRERLLRAAAEVFTDLGYAQSSAEAIARQAGMSKATFYQHYGNKEECLVSLLQIGTGRALEALGEGARAAEPNAQARQIGALQSVLALVEEEPVVASAITMQVAGAGPEVLAMRDAALESYADAMYRRTAAGVAKTGGRQFASMEDAYGVACAILELIGRQLRVGQPENINDLLPVFSRLLFGALEPDAPEAPDAPLQAPPIPPALPEA